MHCLWRRERFWFTRQKNARSHVVENVGHKRKSEHIFYDYYQLICVVIVGHTTIEMEHSDMKTLTRISVECKLSMDANSSKSELKYFYSKISYYWTTRTPSRRPESSFFQKTWSPNILLTSFVVYIIISTNILNSFYLSISNNIHSILCVLSTFSNEICIPNII